MEAEHRANRLLIVGLDGMPYRLIEAMTDQGVMPSLRELISAGWFRKMASAIPEVSCVSWSSIITGTNPGMHGIYGFTDVMDEGYGIRFPNYDSLAVAPFWERDADRPTVVLNVPATYPARPMNGVHVAGFVAPKLGKAVYPPSWGPRLMEMGYRIDVDSQRGHQSTDLFLDDLNQTLQARVAAAQRLWEEVPWTTFMLVFTGTDRLAHFLWDAYEDETHAYHEAFLDHLRRVDSAIGQLVARLEPDDAVLVLSDHGFERLDTNVSLNAVLQRHGLLNIEGERAHLRGITRDSKAFALDPGRVYLHTSGRFPRGCVMSRDRERVLRDLVCLLEGLEIDGKRVLRSVFRREEIYQGPLLPKAPDLVLVAGEGFNLKAGFQSQADVDNGPFTGKHSQPDAFLIAAGLDEPSADKALDVTDVLKIIEPAQSRR